MNKLITPRDETSAAIRALSPSPRLNVRPVVKPSILDSSIDQRIRIPFSGVDILLFGTADFVASGPNLYRRIVE